MCIIILYIVLGIISIGTDFSSYTTIPPYTIKREEQIVLNPIFLFKIYFQEMYNFSSGQFNRSVMSNSLRPMDSSKPGLPVHHQLPKFT